MDGRFRIPCLVASAAMWTGALCSSLVSAGEGPFHPVALGVDMAGSYHLDDRFIVEERLPYWSHAPFYDAVDEIGASHVVVHLHPETRHGAENPARMAAKIRAMEEGMRARGKTFVLNTEDSNFYTFAEIDPGRNEYTTPEGLHRWDVRPEWLAPILPDALPGTSFRGVVYDECEHAQLMGSMFANNPEPPFIPFNTFDRPYLADVRGLSVEASYEALVAAATRLRTEHYGGAVPLQSEDVWPDLIHIFARAGWAVAPKVLMEELSAIAISIGLGAAIQYRETVGGFRTLADMHRNRLTDEFPGHSPEALRSALLLGYWLGVDELYVENFDWPDAIARHPSATPGGALVRWLDDDNYEVTNHGAVVRDFYRNYVPANPRPFRWDEYRPIVGIVRLPDGAVGQPAEFFRRRLLGNPEAPMDAISEEWLQVWPILTHGVARPGSITQLNQRLYPLASELDFFVPIDSVAVFDHRATGPELDSIRCFVVCGHALSAETFAAIAERVARGSAVCVIARRLYDLHAEGELPGEWTVVDAFDDPAVAAALQPFLGEPDVARFRFARHVVEFRPTGVRDATAVRVIERDPDAIAGALLGSVEVAPAMDANADGTVDSADLVAAFRAEADFGIAEPVRGGGE